MKTEPVRLSWEEVRRAAEVGVARQVEAMRRGLKHTHGMRDDDQWRNHVEGACGELAVALALGVPWDATVNTFKSGGDVGDVQVRTRKWADNPLDLIVRDNDRDEDAFVLVVSRLPDFEVVGWAWGGECKLGRYQKSYGGRAASYFVPRRHLRPMADLAGLVCAPQGATA